MTENHGIVSREMVHRLQQEVVKFGSLETKITFIGKMVPLGQKSMVLKLKRLPLKVKAMPGSLRRQQMIFIDT